MSQPIQEAAWLVVYNKGLLELISFNTKLIKLKHDLEQVDEGDQAGLDAIVRQVEELEQAWNGEIAYAEYLREYIRGVSR